MKTPTRTTAHITVFVSALVLILLTAACSSQPAAVEQTAPATTTPPTSTTAAPPPTEAENAASDTATDTTIGETDLRDPYASCQNRSGLTIPQAEANAGVMLGRVKETLSDMNQNDGEHSSQITEVLVFAYSLCGISHGEAAALLEEGELGRQYRRWIEALWEADTYVGFIDVYTQQPCLVAPEFGQMFIPHYDMGKHAEAVNLAGLTVFNPTESEMVEIGEDLVFRVFGVPSDLSDAIASLDDTEVAVTCEELVSALNPVSGATAAETMNRNLSLILSCESGGDYGAVNLSLTETHFDGSRGSFGGYQFGQPTWDWIASTTRGLGWLEGVRPDRAPRWAQDGMARQLYHRERIDSMPGESNYSWRHCNRTATF